MLPTQLLDDDKRSWMVRTKSDAEVFGHMKDFEELVEGPIFYEMCEGAIVPASFASTDNTVEFGFEWSKPLLLDRKLFLERRHRIVPRCGEEAWINGKAGHRRLEFGLK